MVRAKGLRTAIVTNNIREYGDAWRGAVPPRRAVRRRRRLVRGGCAQARPHDLPHRPRPGRRRRSDPRHLPRRLPRQRRRRRAPWACTASSWARTPPPRSTSSSRPASDLAPTVLGRQNSLRRRRSRGRPSGSRRTAWRGRGPSAGCRGRARSGARAGGPAGVRRPAPRRCQASSASAPLRSASNHDAGSTRSSASSGARPRCSAASRTRVSRASDARTVAEPSRIGRGTVRRAGCRSPRTRAPSRGSTSGG